MKSIKKHKTGSYGNNVTRVLAIAIGSLSLAACQTTQPNQGNNAYGNPGQVDPYNPYYGQPQASNQGGYAANSSYPGSPTTGTAAYGQSGAWVEDVSHQDAFNPPPRQAETGSYNPPPASNPRTHVVQRGDTLWRLSKQYGTTVSAIKSANGIASHSNTIVAGSTITIP